MLKGQFPNLFYFMFQSQPEEMPQKMRIENIERLDLYIFDF